MKTRTTTPVIVAILLLPLLILSSPLQAGGRRRVVTASPASPTIEFLGTQGSVDAGTIVWQGGKRRSTIQTRTVAMRIGPASREARGSATLYAFLEIPDSRCTIRVNGVVLGNTPRVVQRDVPIGITTTQRIEIEVPTSAAAGALQASIAWEANSH